MANTNVKELKYAGQPVKVEVANRDSSGKVISSTYTTTSSFNDYKNTVTNALNGKANSSHTHSISQVTDLQKTLDSKASISAVGAADAKATACQKDINSIKTTLNDKLGKNETAKESITIVSPNGRISTPDYGATNKNRVYAQIDISSAQMTTNKPAGDGYIWTHFWDNGSWAGQLYIPTGEYDTSNCHLQRRGQNNGVWRSWEDIAWKKEVDTKANLSHKHAITDVTNLQESLVQTAIDINNAQTAANNAIASINSTDSEALACSSLEVTGSTYTLWTIDGSQSLDLPFKTINGNNIVGTGNVTISANVHTASQSTAGIYKVMTYSPVSTSNWYADDIVLSGKALKYISEQLKWGSSSSSSYPTKTGYLGAYSTNDADKHKQIKLANLTGGTKGRFYYIWGTEKCEYGILSVQQKNTFYRDYDCLAMSSNDHGYWSASELFVSIYIPPNTTYYLWGTNIKNVYARWFE